MWPPFIFGIKYPLFSAFPLCVLFGVDEWERVWGGAGLLLGITVMGSIITVTFLQAATALLFNPKGKLMPKLALLAWLPVTFWLGSELYLSVFSENVARAAIMRDDVEDYLKVKGRRGGFDPDAELYLAASWDKPQIAMFLLENGANPNFIEPGTGLSLLEVTQHQMWLSPRGDHKVMVILRQYGATNRSPGSAGSIGYGTNGVVAQPMDKPGESSNK